MATTAVAADEAAREDPVVGQEYATFVASLQEQAERAFPTPLQPHAPAWNAFASRTWTPMQPTTFEAPPSNIVQPDEFVPPVPFLAASHAATIYDQGYIHGFAQGVTHARHVARVASLRRRHASAGPPPSRKQEQ